MKTWMQGAIIGMFALGLAGCAPTGPLQCKVYMSGVLPVVNNSGSPIVRAAINGHPVALIIDTGATRSLIGRSYIKKLDLTVLGAGGVMTGVGGDELTEIVKIDRLDMGPAKAENFAIFAAGKFGETIDGLPVVGLFGNDFLGNYDTIIDIPDHVVRLVRTEDCSIPTPGWGEKVHTIPITHASAQNPDTELTVKINGHSADALLDSGAANTLITMSVARRGGVTPDMLRHDPVGLGVGVTHEPLKIYRHRFSTLEVGDITFHNINLNIIDDLPNTDVLLGSDFLRHYRVWIGQGRKAYAQHDLDIPAANPYDEVTE